MYSSNTKKKLVAFFTYSLFISLLLLGSISFSYAQPTAKTFPVIVQNTGVPPTFPNPVYDDSIIICMNDTLAYKITGYSPTNLCDISGIETEQYTINQYMGGLTTLYKDTIGAIGVRLKPCNQGYLINIPINTLNTFYIHTEILTYKYMDRDQPIRHNHVTKVIVSTIPSPPTMFTVTPSPTSPPGGKATLQVNNPDPNIDYVWYKSRSVTSILSNKNVNTNPFLTGELSSDTNFYVVAQEKPNFNLGARCGSNYVPVPVKVQGQFFIPNVFTPNGTDIANRKFQVKLLYRNAEMSIFNQWGQKIFQTNNVVGGWDGNISGRPQPTGVYIYVITGNTVNGTPFNYKGSVTLIR